MTRHFMAAEAPVLLVLCDHAAPRMKANRFLIMSNDTAQQHIVLDLTPRYVQKEDIGRTGKTGMKYKISIP